MRVAGPGLMNLSGTEEEEQSHAATQRTRGAPNHREALLRKQTIHVLKAAPVHGKERSLCTCVCRHLVWRTNLTKAKPRPNSHMGSELEFQRNLVVGLLLITIAFVPGAKAWTGEIHGRVVCDVCGDKSVGPEDHVLEGAEVAVLCITKSGEVLNYQAFTNAKGIYTVAETMPETDRWDACLARPISSFHETCTQLGRGSAGVKFSYTRPSGYSHTVRPFVYRPTILPSYCI